MVLKYLHRQDVWGQWVVHPGACLSAHGELPTWPKTVVIWLCTMIDEIVSSIPLTYPSSSLWSDHACAILELSSRGRGSQLHLVSACPCDHSKHTRAPAASATGTSFRIDGVTASFGRWINPVFQWALWRFPGELASSTRSHRWCHDSIWHNRRSHSSRGCLRDCIITEGTKHITKFWSQVWTFTESNFLLVGTEHVRVSFTVANRHHEINNRFNLREFEMFATRLLSQMIPKFVCRNIPVPTLYSVDGDTLRDIAIVSIRRIAIWKHKT